MGTTNKGQISKDDLKAWDGSVSTFSRKTSSGGTGTYNIIDWAGVDVYQGYEARTDVAISSALNAIGSTNKRAIYLDPAAWVISNDLTITSNITLRCPPGVDIQVAAGKTLTIEGAIEAGPYQIFSGTGTVTISGVQIIHDQWTDGSGNDYYPSTDDSIDLGSSSNQFKDIYSDGTIYSDGISLAGNITPETDNSYDLGSSTYEFKDIYADGVGYVDTIAGFTLQGDIDPSTSTQARIDDADYFNVAIRDASQEIIHEVPLSQAFSPMSGWV